MPSENPDYLRDVQYRDAFRLNARARLHERYGRGDWHAWLAYEGGFREGGRCLDVGCGDGAFWRAAGEALPLHQSVQLLDLSPGMVEAALASTRATGRYSNVAGQVADAQQLPFADAEFDSVLAIHVLYHLATPEIGVRELRRVVKSDGCVLVVLNGEGNMRELSQLVATAWGGPGRDRSAMIFGLAQGTEVLRQHFGSVELLSYPDDLIVTEPEDVLDYILSLPRPDLDEAKEQHLREAVNAAFAQGDGSFRISKEIGLLRCKP